MADDGNGRLPTDEEISEALKNSADAVRAPRPDSLQARAQALLNAQRTPLGFTVTQETLQDAVDVLKRQPWEDVYKIMPGLIGAQPIFEEQAPPAKTPEGEGATAD